MSTRNGNGYSVSGPGGVDDTRAEELVALVVAQGYAQRGELGTYYVRGPEGEALYHVERTPEGAVYTTAVPA